LEALLLTILILTTDFGLKDGFSSVLKGVIWGICPDAKIADITHEISPQNILEGAFALWRAYSFFPPKTVHLAVVDPGVGTQRRPLAAKMGEQFFVGPDNGIFTPIYNDAKRLNLPLQIVHLTVQKYWLPNVSHTFHGRDIFAPVGAHLANGVALTDMGPVVDDPVHIVLPVPERTPTGWRAHITVVDIFGNLTTDLSALLVNDEKIRRDIIFRIKEREVHGLVNSYGARSPGDLIALVDSENYIELAIVNENAAQNLQVHVGDIVEVIVR
jgi:S-adenosylmethionine hydrolase